MSGSADASRERIGLAIAATAAILFSFKAILAKLLYRYGVDATTVISLRLTFAGPVFLAIAVHQSLAKDKLALTTKQRYQVVLLGFLGYYLSSFLDFWGLEYIPAALERLILFLTPTVVALLSLAALKKPIAAGQWRALLISYAGLLLVMWDQLHFGGLSARATAIGSGLCFAATLSYSVYLILSGELVKQLGSLRLAAYALSVSCALTAVHYLVFAKQSAWTQASPVYGLSALNALLCTVLPVFLTMHAIKTIGAARTSQLSMLGPVSLVFLGAWILNERISLLQIAGTIVVLVGVSWLMFPKASGKSAG